MNQLSIEQWSDHWSYQLPHRSVSAGLSISAQFPTCSPVVRFTVLSDGIWLYNYKRLILPTVFRPCYRPNKRDQNINYLSYVCFCSDTTSTLFCKVTNGSKDFPSCFLQTTPVYDIRIRFRSRKSWVGWPYVHNFSLPTRAWEAIPFPILWWAVTNDVCQKFMSLWCEFRSRVIGKTTAQRKEIVRFTRD